MIPVHLEKVYFGSRAKACGGVFASLGFVALGVWLLNQPFGIRGAIGGWIAILFFVPVSVLWVAAIIAPSRLTLVSDGFILKQALLAERRFYWSQIEKVWATKGALGSLVVWTYKRRPSGIGMRKRITGQPADYDDYLPIGWTVPAEVLVDRMRAARASLEIV